MIYLKIGGQVANLGLEELFVDNLIEHKEKEKLRSLFNLLFLLLMRLLRMRTGNQKYDQKKEQVF